jgi:hypothetical protein
VILATVFFAHAWWFFFDPGHGAQWYEGNVYGNLVAIIPTGVLLFLYLRSRHLAVVAAHQELKKAHDEHARKLDLVLKHFDPEGQGSIAQVLDALDPVSPGGLQVIAEKIDALAPPKVE